jgi:hypothetical protein
MDLPAGVLIFLPRPLLALAPPKSGFTRIWKNEEQDR